MPLCDCSGTKKPLKHPECKIPGYYCSKLNRKDNPMNKSSLPRTGVGRIYPLKEGLKFYGEYLPHRVTVLGIDVNDNKLRVRNESSVPWEEDWNLEHTLVGFEQGAYSTEPYPKVNSNA